MAQLTPQEAVLIEFLRYLSETVHASEPVILVLRGSLLLRHWFGESARRAADLDLECFERVRGHRGERFPSLVDHGRGLCCYAIENAWRHRGAAQFVEFDEIDAPADGDSLWSYGSPGQRFYAGWTWHGGEDQTGRIQIDIAESRSYSLNEISVDGVDFVSIEGSPFRFPSYTPEMMLAAKLSWLLRSFRRRLTGRGVSAPEWKGDPKDLFDVHLLLTKANLRADVFQKSLLVVGTEDQLDWNNLQALFDVRWAKMTDADFPNWSEFCERHKTLVASAPVEMLETIADGLEPLLGDFYLREEMPFLLAINADPVDESTYLIYADWLEERGERRGQFLRLFAKFFFRADELPREELARTLRTLHAALRTTSVPWLLQLFGTSARFGEIRRRIEH
jgi:uncharacterized protein (TIGR02996 family)